MVRHFMKDGTEVDDITGMKAPDAVMSIIRKMEGNHEEREKNQKNQRNHSCGDNHLAPVNLHD